MLLNNQKSQEKSKRKSKYAQNTNENKNTTTPNLWDSVKSSARGTVHSNTSLPQETREKSNKQPNFKPKVTRERINEEPQGQQKERNHKNQGRNKNKGDYSKNQQN